MMHVDDTLLKYGMIASLLVDSFVAILWRDSLGLHSMRARSVWHGERIILSKAAYESSTFNKSGFNCDELYG